MKTIFIVLSVSLLAPTLRAQAPVRPEAEGFVEAVAADVGPLVEETFPP